jgi:hypothetical protein
MAEKKTLPLAMHKKDKMQDSSMNERRTYHRAFVPNATVHRRNNSRHVSNHPGDPQLGK